MSKNASWYIAISLSNNPGKIKQINRKTIAKMKSKGMKMNEYFKEIWSSSLKLSINANKNTNKKQLLCVK